MKTNKFKFFSFLIFISTLTISHSLGEVFYNSVDGTDFYRYFRYIEYFNGEIEATSREQGLFYFWIVSIFIELSSSFYIADKWEFIYSTAIQAANLSLYLIGLFGLFLLLKNRKYSSTYIFLSFSLLNFFPPVFGGRLIMKPEILAFALFPWILFCLEKYFHTFKLYYLLLTVPLMSVLATSKGTIILTIISSLIFIFFKDLKNIKLKHFFISATIFTFLTSILYFENSNINTVSMLFHPEQDSYLFKAPLVFLIKINFYDLVFNPIRNFHADSLLGITIIDLFNDYFNRYWDHPRSLFSKSRTTYFANWEYLRRNLSSLISIIFLLLSLIYPIRKNDSKLIKVYFVGIFVLSLTAIGVFGLHFNPEKGDTVKTHYYFYLIGVSFVFFIINLLKNKKIIHQVIFTFFGIFVFIFFLGFPKDYTEDFSNDLKVKVPTTISCNYFSFYYENLIGENINCLNQQEAVCGVFEDYNLPEVHPDGYLIFSPDENFTPINLNDKSGSYITVNGYAECIHYVDGGYINNQSFSSEDRTPFLNNIFLYIIFINLIFISFIGLRSYSSSNEEI